MKISEYLSCCRSNIVENDLEGQLLIPNITKNKIGDEDSLEEGCCLNTCPERVDNCCSKIFTYKAVTSGIRYCGCLVMGMGLQAMIQDIVNFNKENPRFHPSQPFNSMIGLGAVMFIMGHCFRPDDN